MELTQVVELTKEGNDGVLEVLYNLGCCDADFTGDNNDSESNYNWKDVAADSNNRDWLINETEKLYAQTKNIPEVVQYYLGCWLDHDSYYYDYTYEILYNKEDGSFLGIALALLID